jgi:O-antigen ligase
MKRQIQSPLILGYLVGLIVFFTPFLGFIASKGLAPIVIIGSIFSVLILWAQSRTIKWLGLPAPLILLCFCIWALLSSFWSIDAVASSVGSARLFGNIMAGGLLFVTIKNLTGEEKKVVLKFFLAGFLIVICIVVFEILLGGPIFIALKDQVFSIERVRSGEFSGIFWLNPIMVVLSLFIWPIALGMYKKLFISIMNKYSGFFVVSGFVIVFILTIIIGFSSATLGLSCGLFGALLIFIFGRRAAVTASMLLAVVSFSIPFCLNMLQDPISQINSLMPLPSSAEHRIGIWKFTSDKTVENPIIGWGMNASKTIPGGTAFLYTKDGKHIGRSLPLHPHNVILQTWLELGLPGVILFVALCIFIIMTSVNRFRLKFESAAIFGQFITILGIANLSFGMWQAWWIAAIWLSAGLMVLVTEMDRRIDA